MIENDIAPRNLPHRCLAKDQLNQGKSEVQKYNSYSSASITIFLTTDSPDYPDVETPLRCVAKIS